MVFVKKALAMLLTCSLLLALLPAATSALAEAATDAADPAAQMPVPSSNTPLGDTLIVGNTTEMSGNFFSEMFGNNTADIDARVLLHGYNLMEWISATGSYGINQSVVSGLVVTDDADGNRTYTLNIYTDLAYSDGTPITAADYAFSMLLSIHPAMKEIGAQTVDSDYIVGIDDYKAGRTDVLTGMRILNDRMMSITVKAEYIPFFYELALLDYNPYPIHILAPGCEVVDTGDGVAIRNADPTVTEPIFTADLLRKTILDPDTGYLYHPTVVSGAYVLDSYDNETHVAEFSINSRYKGNSYGFKPMIPHLVYRPVSPDTMIQELADGKVNLLNKCVSADVISDGMQLTGNGFNVSNYPRSGYSFISYSCELPATNDPVVRKAIAHCLDKTQLVTDYVSNYGLAVDGYYGIGQWVYQLVNGTMAPPTAEPGSASGATTQAAYLEEQAAWAALSLDGLTVYDFDIDEANRLLDEGGWMLDRQGGAYDAGTDDVRCKTIDGVLVALDLSLIYPEGNDIADSLQKNFVDHLAQAGVKVTMEAKPMTDLLDIYYRNVPRDTDLIYLATNFATVFDPSYTFSPDDAYQGSSNRTGIIDEDLYQRAVDMRLTEPGDVLTYCQKWVAFQERWSEVLPAIPVYSNVYFDFYSEYLQNYEINSGLTWAEAILGAYLGEPVVVEEPAEGEVLDDGTVIL